MEEIRYTCPECGGALRRDGAGPRCNGGHAYAWPPGGLLDLLPRVIPESLRVEAAHHEGLQDDWADLHQLRAPRNLHFHQAIIDCIASRSTATSRILEIGGGPGFDLRLFLDSTTPFEHYLFSEVSDGLLARAARDALAATARPPRGRITYCAMDAERLPLENAQFDVTFLVAVLHRVDESGRALREMTRVIVPGGSVLLGMEPNRRWA